MTTPQVYQALRDKVKFICAKLNLFKYVNTVGRKLSLSIVDTLTFALYRHVQGIPTKKAIWNDFKPLCSYKTLVVNMNRRATLATLILLRLLAFNRQEAHPIKHTDSTDIPVCFNKNAVRHKTMQGLAAWGYSGKGWFYGLKLHLTSDLARRMLSFLFTPGNTHGTKAFMKLNRDIDGIVVADAEYISQNLAKEFHQEYRRALFAQPRKNMRKIITAFQKKIYDTRMLIELNFRNLKMFHGLITSLPRSVSGYFSNYIYAILAYALR